MNLRIPGPTPLPPDTLEAVGRQMISHRSTEFVDMFNEIVDGLKTIYETENDVYVMTSSGTGGMETAIANTLSPGDRVLSVPMGVFGERFAKIAQAYNADLVKLQVPMGQVADPEQVATVIREQGPFKAVLLTQNETSSAVTNDLAALCKAIHDADPSPLIIVDGISGMGAIRLQTDAWGIDVAVSGSQKAWMAPPGLAFVSFSERAWAAYETAKNPRFYFDLGLAKKYALKGQTPATPNVSALYGLQVSLRRMVAEGIVALDARHQAIADYFRKSVLDLGLKLYGDPAHRSNTVTAVVIEDRPASEVLSRLSSEYGIYCGASKDPSVEMVRVGHMGYVSEADLDEVTRALAEILGV